MKYNEVVFDKEVDGMDYYEKCEEFDKAFWDEYGEYLLEEAQPVAEEIIQEMLMAA